MKKKLNSKIFSSFTLIAFLVNPLIFVIIKFWKL